MTLLKTILSKYDKNKYTKQHVPVKARLRSRSSLLCRVSLCKKKKKKNTRTTQSRFWSWMWEKIRSVKYSQQTQIMIVWKNPFRKNIQSRLRSWLCEKIHEPFKADSICLRLNGKMTVLATHISKQTPSVYGKITVQAAQISDSICLRQSGYYRGKIAV